MKPGCSVFVGNIDFETEESEVIREMSAAGRVVSFRMMYDRATGKSKGFGFCEYESPLIAENAKRTLKIMLRGRLLKINYAEADSPARQREPPAKPMQIDSILGVLDAMDTEHLQEVLEYLKKMAVLQPTRLRELMDQNPNLLVATLAALLQLGLADEARVEALMRESFRVEALREQIAARVRSMDEADLDGLAEDVKYRLTRLQNMLCRNK